VLARHVRVQRVARLCHGAAQHAAVSGTDGVLVLHVRAKRVSRPVDLAALRARPRVGGADAHHVKFAANLKKMFGSLVYLYFGVFHWATFIFILLQLLH